MSAKIKPYNSEHGKYVVTECDEWEHSEPCTKLRDAVYQYINDAGCDVGDALEVGMCVQWEPDVPTLDEYRDSVNSKEWNWHWLSEITPAMEASFKAHMQNAALQWLKQNDALPDWYWVRHTRTITVTKELLIRFYREYKLYSDDDIADLYFGDEASAQVESA